MTKFECTNGHTFRFPAFKWVSETDAYEGHMAYMCPEPTCEVQSFQVIEMGGEPIEEDQCEGACTL